MCESRCTGLGESGDFAKGVSQLHKNRSGGVSEDTGSIRHWPFDSSDGPGCLYPEVRNYPLGGVRLGCLPWKEPSVPNRINSLVCAGLSLWLGASLTFAQSSIPRSTSGGTRPAAKKSTIPAGEVDSSTEALPRAARAPAGRTAPETEPAESAEPQQPITKPRPRAMQGPNPQAPAQPGPAPQVAMQPVSQEMRDLLDDWEQKTTNIKSLFCPITRYEFDDIFTTETRSEGTICYENPDKGRIDFMPANEERMKIRAGRVDIHGKPYKVLEGSHSRWICTGKIIYIMDMTAKSYDKVQIPPQMQGQNITRSPLPFIFGMKARDAIARFALRFGEFHNPEGQGVDKHKKPNRKILHIVANPFDPNVAREYTQAEIILDATNFRPLNLRTKDPSGNKETVYSFDQSKLQENVNWGLKNPFKDPLLIGWQCMHDQKAEPEQKAPGNREARMDEK